MNGHTSTGLSTRDHLAIAALPPPVVEQTAYDKVRNGEAHFYTECSNRGTCDRTTGLCTCFTGYVTVTVK